MLPSAASSSYTDQSPGHLSCRLPSSPSQDLEGPKTPLQGDSVGFEHTTRAQEMQLHFLPSTDVLGGLGQVASPLWASLSSSVEWQ